MEPQNHPPTYQDSDGNNTSRPDNSAEPPNYALAADSDPRAQLFGNELPSLVLDGVRIHPVGRPEQPLYELSSQITQGHKGICGIEKVIYRLTNNSGEGSVRARTRHIYDVRPSAVVSNHLLGHVDIIGKLGAKSTYKHQELVGRRPHWSSCDVKDTLQAKDGFRIKLFQKKEKPIQWKDKTGRVIALETMAPKPKDKSMEVQPRLDIQIPSLDAKDFDFLVACWVGRLWRVYQIHKEEPLSLDKVRRMTAQSPEKGSGIYN